MTNLPTNPDDSTVDVTLDQSTHSRADQLAAVIDEYAQFLRAGNAPKRSEIIQAHPQLAKELDECLASVEFIHAVEPEDDIISKQLGDFQIVREIGRGGMGAVYEAKQISLDRKVAIKVLRFGGVSDRDAIDRFRREAETVANLHHTNIVPIFSVGREDGVNFYAMQLIDGRSLDRVVDEQERRIDVKEIAGWGLQAAEALAHAHERDVIHRDVKPSNLILDADGRIWLSDFGLAKRMDDITLSITGTLLGTPRYMSPEQAEVSVKSVDHRSDIYSLGATLYELATGQPVFSADTPHGVISQILTSDPIPPRKHRSDLPRDLETILLKCLSKEAAGRYSTANELAEDLRAVGEDRPIRARRPNFVERSKRWLRARKQGVVVAASAALITVACISLIVAERHFARKSREATLDLTTNLTGLVAEVLDDSGRSGTHVLPTQKPVTVEGSKARANCGVALHVSGEGELSQRFELNVKPGERKSVEVSIDDQRIGRKIPIEKSFCVFPFHDGVDPILLEQSEICRWNVELDSAVWKLDMRQQVASVVAEARKTLWPREMALGYSSIGKFDQQPFILGQLDRRERSAFRVAESLAAIDFDVDQEDDVLMACRGAAWLLAVSGRSGEVLWVCDRSARLPTASSARREEELMESAVLAPPLAACDIDHDGIQDVIAMFGRVAATSPKQPSRGLAAEVWIEAVSGQTGESIWRSDVEPEWLQLPAGVEIPYAFRWFVSDEGTSSAGNMAPNHQSERNGLLWRKLDREHRRMGKHCYVPDAPQIIHRSLTGGARSRSDASDLLLRYVAGTHLIELDLNTGEIRGEPKNLEFRPERSVQWADMDGDKTAEIVLCKPSLRTSNGPVRDSERLPQVQVSAWSVTKAEWLWRREFDAHWPRSPEPGVPAPAWPLVQDLDGDGACELLVPDGTTLADAPVTHRKAPWGELAVVHGKTGDTRWRRRVFTLDQQVDRFVVGPDLDGDGTRETFVASLWGVNYDLFIEALSGADGQPIWQQQIATNGREQSATEFHIGRIAWWNGGNDGGAQLVVPVHPNRQSSRNACMYCVSASDGSVQQIAKAADAAWFGDVNRDGIDDLCSYVPPSDRRQTGELSLYHGVARDYWRQMVDRRVAVCDLDDDGIRDMVQPTGDNRLEATSGISRKVLWTTELPIDELRRFRVVSQDGNDVAGLLSPQDQRLRDIDRDGTPDLLIGHITACATSFSPLHAVSGRTGKLIWNADARVRKCDGFPMTIIRDLDAEGDREVAFVSAMHLDQSNTEDPQGLHLWLVVLSAEDGKLKWKIPLSSVDKSSRNTRRIRAHMDGLRFESPTVDLNSDGALDFVLPRGVGDEGVEYIAISGSDGAVLWNRSIASRVSATADKMQVPPAVAVDLDGNGTPEVITLEYEDTDQGHRFAHVVAIDGGTGRVRWQERRKIDTSYGRMDNPSDQQSRPRIIPVTAELGRTNIGVVLRDSSAKIPFHLELFDYEGNHLSRIAMSKIPGHAGNALRADAHDVDRDGLDEILFWNGRSLVAMRGDKSADIVWECPIPTRFNAEFMGLLPAANNAQDSTRSQSVAVMRQGTGDNSLIGVDANDGNISWVCVGPNARRNNGWVVPETVELMGSLADATPVGLFRFTSFSLCRQSAAMDSSLPRRQLRVRQAMSLGRTGHVDPRRLRDLPWVSVTKGPEELRVVQAAKSMTILCATLVLTPLFALLLVLRRRTRDLTAFLTLSIAVVSMSVGVYFGYFSDAVAHIGPPWVIAVAPIPLVVFVVFIIRQVAYRERRSCVRWLFVAVIASILLSVLTLWLYSTHPLLALQHGEAYSLSGWYFIVFWGIYFTGLMMLVVFPLKAVRTIAQRRRLDLM